MNKNWFLLVIVLFALLALKSESPVERILEGFKKYTEQYPQEKIYVHTDRSYYLSGETVWFNSYLVAGPYHEISTLSKTLYVELVDEKNFLLKQQKYYCQNGVASGNIQLPDSLSSGNYIIRAYTNWMKNFPEEYFFYKKINIWKNQISDHSEEKDNLSIQFFPEGGNLIAEINSKIGFKAIGSDGLGKRIKGKVLDSNGIQVLEFKSNFLGMGAFSLTPARDNYYVALIDGIDSIFTLPNSAANGIVLSAFNNPDRKFVVLKIQTNDLKNLRTIYLIGQTRGIVSFSATINLSSNVVYTQVPKDQLPEGITQLTIVDSYGKPLCERLIYIEKDEKPMKLIAVPDKEIYKPREKIKVRIEARDNEGKPLQANLSLAVCDDSQILIDENSETIKSYLNLTSELKGYVETPGYYFNTQNSDRHQALDFLLLTQGWRRFTYEQILSNSFLTPINHIETGLTIRGKIFDKYNNKPIVGGKITYLEIGSYLNYASTKSDQNGLFEFRDLIFYDSAKAILQGETRKGNKSIKFTFDSLQKRIELPHLFGCFPSSLEDYQKNMIAKGLERKQIDDAYDFNKDAKILDAVEIISIREKLPRDRIYGAPSKSIQVAGNLALENLLHPLQLVQGRVAGVWVSGDGTSWNVQIQGTNSISSGTTPLILINNMPVDLEALNMITPRDIESFDVWKGAETAIFGARGANGVLAFYTSKSYSYSPPLEGSIIFSQPGYNIAREFYSPDYEVSKSEYIKPDRRATLFWGPQIQTDSTGKATIEFFNHDIETTITGIIEGVSSTGLAESVSFKYRIEKN